MNFAWHSVERGVSSSVVTCFPFLIPAAREEPGVETLAMIGKGSCSRALFSPDGVAVFIGTTNGEVK